MTPAVYLALTATIAVAALTPGPAVTAIVARAITDGVRPALAINAGVVTGDLIFFALAAAGMAADLANPAVRIESVQIGFNGVYKTGHWMPVWVTLANAGPSVDVRLQIAALSPKTARYKPATARVSRSLSALIAITFIRWVSSLAL
jgi:hypothetical protein